jgi:hypothetical protein
MDEVLIWGPTIAMLIEPPRLDALPLPSLYQPPAMTTAKNREQNRDQGSGFDQLRRAKHAEGRCG